MKETWRTYMCCDVSAVVELEMLGSHSEGESVLLGGKKLTWLVQYKISHSSSVQMFCKAVVLIVSAN